MANKIKKVVLVVPEGINKQELLNERYTKAAVQLIIRKIPLEYMDLFIQKLKESEVANSDTKA